jgi:hypothetical protein
VISSTQEGAKRLALPKMDGKEGDTEREGAGARQSWLGGLRGAGDSPGEKRRRNPDGPEDDACAVSPRTHLRTRSGPLTRTQIWRCSEELFADVEGAPAAPPRPAALPYDEASGLHLIPFNLRQSTPEPEGCCKKSSGNPATSAGPARCTSSKAHTPPYNPICNGFFAKLSPNPHRSLPKPSFPTCISPNRWAGLLLQTKTAWPKEAVKQEQAELQALLKAAQCEGAVELTSGSVRSTVKPASALVL